jgi:hypothetical protein
MASSGTVKVNKADRNRKGEPMIVGTAPSRNRCVSALFAAAGLVRALFNAIGPGFPSRGRSRSPLDPLVVDERLHVDQGALDHAAWLAWCERNLSDREVELMRIADAADRDSSVARVPSIC